MIFPKTNKIHQDVESVVEDNAKMLEELLSQADWRRLVLFFYGGVFMIASAMFILIVAVRLACLIF